jgi:GNAT superfamily N-acetyltransferase
MSNKGEYMYKVTIIKNKKELKELFDFLSRVFYEESIEYNEHYFTMSERYEEMLKQYEVDKNMLMYIKSNDKIIAGITGKNMSNGKITISMIAVDKDYRRQGLAKELINAFENRCLENRIYHIDLGARYRACPLYNKLGYKYYLMVQVFDFITIDDVRKLNINKLKEISSWQGDTYGFIIYNVKKISKEYIDYFENNVPTVYAQYIFEKDLEKTSSN